MTQIKRTYTGPRYEPISIDRETTHAIEKTDFTYGTLKLRETGNDIAGIHIEISANTGYLGEFYGDLINPETFHDLLSDFVARVTNAIETEYLNRARTETENHIINKYPDPSTFPDLFSFVNGVINGRDYNHAPGTVEYLAETETVKFAVERLNQFIDYYSDGLTDLNANYLYNGP